MPRNDKRGLGRGLADIQSKDPCAQVAALTAGDLAERAAPHTFVVDTNSASEAICAFLDGLRASGTQLRGTNAQLCGLIVDALDSIGPNTSAAATDADTLARDFEAIVEVLSPDGDESVYDKEEEDD